jgi:trehalose 6-phosphate phosphatase
MTPPPLPQDAALFLDFDGCLVDIAPTPDSVVVSPELAARLDRLHARLDGALALISGRNVEDLRGRFPGFPGVIAGSHGAEMSLKPGRIDAAHGIDFDLLALHRQARELASPHPAILVEDKPHGVALHYRADPSLREVVEDAMRQLAEAFPGLELQPAKMAVELRPAGVRKDDALARLMTMPPFAGRLPIYAGDDLTDEPAMAAAQDQGGFAIKVGEGDSVARHRLPDPAALSRWLDEALA